MTTPNPTAPQAGGGISQVRCRVFTVPTERPEADGTLEWSATTIVTAEVMTSNGSTGLGWTYASAGCRPVIDGPLAEAVFGLSPMDVPAAHEAMVRSCRNIGRPGIAACAISAVDTAIWDLKARILGVSLAELFGRCRNDVPIYGSGGFTTYDDDTTAAQLERWLEDFAISRVKIKVGESWGSNVQRDVHRVALARDVIGDGVELFVDANGGYSAKQAIRVGRRYEDDFGVTWFEEPVSSDDLVGLRLVRDALSVDVAAGEYGYDETYFDHMVRGEAVDCIQADATRCGGYTSWLRIAALAGAHGLEISAHCAPNLHAPVALGVPNLRHVEYFYDHARLDPMLFDGVIDPRDGAIYPDGDCLGHGMAIQASATCFEVA